FDCDKNLLFVFSADVQVEDRRGKMIELEPGAFRHRKSVDLFEEFLDCPGATPDAHAENLTVGIAAKRTHLIPSVDQSRFTHQNHALALSGKGGAPDLLEALRLFRLGQLSINVRGAWNAGEPDDPPLPAGICLESKTTVI